MPRLEEFRARHPDINVLIEIPQGMFAMAIASAALPSLARLRSQMEEAAKAEGKEFSINLVTPDNGEKFVIELNDQTLTYSELDRAARGVARRAGP